MVNDTHHNGCAPKSPTAQKYMDVEITSSLDWSFHINSIPIIRLLGFSETPQALRPKLKSLSTKLLYDLKWSTAALCAIPLKKETRQRYRDIKV